MRLRVGTRGSRLSLVQTDLVIAKIHETLPTIQVEKVIIHTSGDLDRETPLYSLGQKGIFEREIDDAVLSGSVDLAVHSLKDLPVLEADSELAVVAAMERGPPLDVLVTRTGERLKDLSPGSTVGTSSLLRLSQLRRVRPDLNPMPIRGNVETRVNKVIRGDYDAAILAEAGLSRLNMIDKIAERLPASDFLPAPGQGTIAIVSKIDNSPISEILRSIDHPLTHVTADAEREVVRVLEGGCKVPIGALASVERSQLELTAHVLSMDGTERLEARTRGSLNDRIGLARRVADELITKGAKRLEEGWRSVYA